MPETEKIYEWRRLKQTVVLECTDELEPGGRPEKITLKSGTLVREKFHPSGGLSTTERHGKEWQFTRGDREERSEPLSSEYPVVEYKTDIVKGDVCFNAEEPVKGLKLSDHLEVRGKEGWELIQALPGSDSERYIFKRAKPLA